MRRIEMRLTLLQRSMQRCAVLARGCITVLVVLLCSDPERTFRLHHHAQRVGAHAAERLRTRASQRGPDSDADSDVVRELEIGSVRVAGFRFRHCCTCRTPTC
jgi:hypothetical protein